MKHSKQNEVLIDLLFLIDDLSIKLPEQLKSNLVINKWTDKNKQSFQERFLVILIKMPCHLT